MKVISLDDVETVLFKYLNRTVQDMAAHHVIEDILDDLRVRVQDISGFHEIRNG